jgi:hypothetical protein
MRAFGYSLVAFDMAGVNVFFVHDSELGAPLPNTFASVTPDYTHVGWHALHPPCKQMVWAHVDAAAGLSQVDFMRHMRPVVLSHDDVPGGPRIMKEVAITGVLGLHRQRRHQGASPAPNVRRRQSRVANQGVAGPKSGSGGGGSGAEPHD